MSEPQPQARPRRRVYIVGGALVALLLAGGGYLAYGGTQSRSASSVVLAYLHALVRSDAKTALSLGREPSDPSLLTPQILRAQQARGPITGIHVVGTDSGDYGAVVHVKYRVGGQPVDNHIELTRKGNGWQLVNVAVSIEMSGTNYLPAPSFFGVPLGNRVQVYVFPGLVTFGTVDEDFALTPGSAVFTDPDVPTMVSPRATLSPAGVRAAVGVVRSAMTTCARSRALAPAHCPQRAARPHVAGLVAGSYRWQAPTSYIGLTFPADQRKPSVVHVTGHLTWKLRYLVRPKRAKHAKHAPHAVTRTVVVRSSLTGTIDFNTSPPAYQFS